MHTLTPCFGASALRDMRCFPCDQARPPGVLCGFAIMPACICPPVKSWLVTAMTSVVLMGLGATSGCVCSMLQSFLAAGHHMYSSLSSSLSWVQTPNHAGGPVQDLTVLPAQCDAAGMHARHMLMLAALQTVNRSQQGQMYTINQVVFNRGFTKFRCPPFQPASSRPLSALRLAPPLAAFSPSAPACSSSFTAAPSGTSSCTSSC